MKKASQRADYTFKYNRKLGRHGWLRLTPAYSVKLVNEIVASFQLGSAEDGYLLDPFSGTATTGVVAAQAGLQAHLFDINPFLVWFGNIKCSDFTNEEITWIRSRIQLVILDFARHIDQDNWVPDIHNIERWWSVPTLRALAALRRSISEHIGEPSQSGVAGLAWISFCRLAIDTSSAAFNHVSMSFNDTTTSHTHQTIRIIFESIADSIIDSASEKLKGHAQVYLADSKSISAPNSRKYSLVVTSPPYPNRISYIRELRPYMYWTEFLVESRQAGELDWKAIGGTWGVATSRLQRWEPPTNGLPSRLIHACDRIRDSGRKNDELMSLYVQKYFHDMKLHLESLGPHLTYGARLGYIVGNSTFYGVRVDTEQVLAEMLVDLGFDEINSQIVRKRNSKKELFEYLVTARYPG